MSQESEFNCEVCYQNKPLAEKNLFPYKVGVPEEDYEEVLVCSGCLKLIRDEGCEDVDTFQLRPIGVKPGDLWKVEAKGYIDTEWLFQVMTVLAKDGKKYYPCIKLGSDIRIEQIVLFDQEGDELASEHGQDSGLKFFMTDKYDPEDEDDYKTWAKIASNSLMRQ